MSTNCWSFLNVVWINCMCVAAYMCSWQVSSLNESLTNQILQLKPAQLVRFNQRQLLRVYPSNYRVDSSNFNPQPFGTQDVIWVWISFFLQFIMNNFLSNYQQSLFLLINDETATTLIWTAMDPCWQMARSCFVFYLSQLHHAFVWNVVSSFQSLSTIKQKAVCYSWTGQNLQRMETAAMYWSQNACVKVGWCL